MVDNIGVALCRKYLDKSPTERIVHTFVSSHLDYCNGLLAGLPNTCTHLAPLQRIQNSAARYITLTKKLEHITPIIRFLHWLPIHHSIHFKILLLVYKAVHNSAPVYLQDPIALPSSSLSSGTRHLRSSSIAHFQLPLGPHTMTRYGDQAFSVIAPTLWNTTASSPAFS